MMKVAFLLCVVAGLSGCLEREEPKTSHGPESSYDEVLKNYIELDSKNDPGQAKVGDFVHYAEIQELAEQVKTVLSDTGETITEIQEGDSAYYFNIVTHHFVYLENETKKTSTEGYRYVPKPGANEESLKIQFKPQDLMPIKTLSHLAKQAAESTAYATYHNLQRSSLEIEPPTKVKQRPNCGGLPGCVVKLDRLYVEQVVHNGSEEPEKMQIEFLFSSSVPWLARLYQNCVTGLVSLGGNKVLIRQCDRTEDFTFGSQTP